MRWSLRESVVDCMIDPNWRICMLNYDTMEIEEFDAVVTGELTHYALHMEHHIEKCIARFFGVKREREFFRLVLHRDGLTFQDKIDIVRALVPIAASGAVGLGQVLTEVETFKALRNSAAHGRDDGSAGRPLKLVFESVSRSGKEKRVEITPMSHRACLQQAETLLERLSRLAALVPAPGSGDALD